MSKCCRSCQTAEDNGGPWTLAVSDPTRHHGLDIIRTLASGWGIEGDHTGRTERAGLRRSC